MGKATFTLGVFGVACRNDKDILRIKVNVRTDQEAQRKAAGLPEDSKVLIFDLPGGSVEREDFPDVTMASLFRVLCREVAEETGGCAVDCAGDFSAPFLVVTNNQDDAKPVGDIALWMPIILRGIPIPSSEALAHPWITLDQLEAETEYRAVGKLGRVGRTARMIRAGFEWFEERKKLYPGFSQLE